MIPSMVATRLIAVSDAAALAELVVRNREFLAPWEPIRPESYFTVDGQRGLLEEALESSRARVMVPHVVLEHGAIVGRVNVNNIVRGPFQSGSLGYWVSADRTGRGVATAAVRAMVHVAFRDIGLHRLEAGTLLHNIASQRVLERNGFVRFGTARSYLNIDGRWQDHAMYQLINGAYGLRSTAGGR